MAVCITPYLAEVTNELSKSMKRPQGISGLKTLSLILLGLLSSEQALFLSSLFDGMQLYFTFFFQNLMLIVVNA